MTCTAAASPIAEKPASIEAAVASAVSVAKHALQWPFDTMREHHANAVRVGLIERSLIASARFERKLAVLEQSVLGACARRV